MGFNVLDLSVIDIILACRFPLSPLFSICSSSDPDFYFHQLFPVAFCECGVLRHLFMSSAKRG